LLPQCIATAFSTDAEPITMNNPGEPSNISFTGGGDASFLLRWRGRQEGPYSAELIQQKLSVNEIGMLHEILHHGRWITIRDYIAEREATLRAQRQAQEEQERREREDTERQARELETHQRAAALAEEKRRNDLLEASLHERQSGERGRSTTTLPIKSHRGGLILTYALIGLFVCFPFSIGAWSMGSDDLREMDAGLMDPGGRSLTSSGRSVGMLGTILWIGGILIYFLSGVFS
jgi:hypothetical protein